VKARYFRDPAAWRAWLEQNHARAGELWVGFWKRGTGRASITWPESVDGALCFGWIDGVRQSIDEERYRIRFTPRRAGSIWSRNNVTRMNELIEAGLVHARGLAALEARKDAKTALYSYERAEEATLSSSEIRTLRASKAAWADWSARPPWYKKTSAHWITSAKKPETRARRFAILLASAAKGDPIPVLARPGLRTSASGSRRSSTRARPRGRRA